jgi:T4-like virus Myoviridae tail sheath stabiliser
MFQYFYNKSLRKLVVGFGALFNNIVVEHANPDNVNSPIPIRVPITYAPQEKFIRRLLEPSSITDGTRIETQLPKLSYIITSIIPDNSRRRNRLSSLRAPAFQNSECQPTGEEILEQVPVNIQFSLFIYTRHIDDTLQIFEQIIPYFNPDHVITIALNDVQGEVKIPITMVGNNLSERFDGDFSNRRINISSINFVAKSYIYGPERSYTNISTVDITNLEFD